MFVTDLKRLVWTEFESCCPYTADRLSLFAPLLSGMGVCVCACVRACVCQDIGCPPMKRTKQLFSLLPASATSLMPLVLYTSRLNTMDTYSEISTHIHTFIHSYRQPFGADTVFISCIRTVLFYWFYYTHTCVGAVNGPFRLFNFLSAVRLLCFMKCPLVAPQSTLVKFSLYCLFVQPTVMLHLSPASDQMPGSCMMGKKSMCWTTTPHNHSINLLRVFSFGFRSRKPSVPCPPSPWMSVSKRKLHPGEENHSMGTTVTWKKKKDQQTVHA